MRTGSSILAGLSFLAVTALFPPVGPAGDESGARDSTTARLREFLTWIHPADQSCGPLSDLRTVERWNGGLRLGYRVGCPDTRQLEAVLQIRQARDVWQVAGGFEAPPDAIARELEAIDRQSTEVGGGPDGGGIHPPPGNAPVVGAATALRLVVPAGVIEATLPLQPEEASRSRLIGPVRVEILVDVSPEGAPLRARPLRGPEPDLGLRRAAIDSVMTWRFRPARLGDMPIRSFVAVPLNFQGLPRESADWVHRALYRLEGIASADRIGLEEALRRVEGGADFADAGAATVEGASAASFLPGDWGIVHASDLPSALRRRLHAAPVGSLVGPVEAGDLSYLVRKKGEVYYAISSVRGDEVSYRVVHEVNPPSRVALLRAIEDDIARYLGESRRAAFINEAARLMGIRQKRVDLGRLRVHTDVLDPDEIRRLEQVVDAAIGVHEGFWNSLTPLRPFSETILVYAFARAGDHDRVRRLWKAGADIGGVAATDEGHPSTPGDRPIWSRAGEYIPSSRILSIPCEEMGGHLPVPIVIHEAIHMLNFERVYAPGARPTPWFEEGLATYYSFSHIDSRLRIQPGAIRKTGTIEAGPILVQFDPRAQLRQHLQRVGKEGAVPLGDLLDAGSRDPLWTGGRSARLYGASWTLVHFLNHAGDGRYRPLFLEYARREAAGAGGKSAFEEIFGDLAVLETAWHRYERRL
ncbi:MAG: hypothetical protein O7A63_00060 [Acidobacteria bacterium]|nr:hypothetical protein [Acidobacteriota bacterium]